MYALEELERRDIDCRVSVTMVLSDEQRFSDTQIHTLVSAFWNLVSRDVAHVSASEENRLMLFVYHNKNGGWSFRLDKVQSNTPGSRFWQPR